MRAVVVTHESAAVIDPCLASLAAAAPRRGLEIVVADNASGDGSADLAAARIGADRVRRLPVNRGFAAGVNAACAGYEGPWIAVINPDVIAGPGALDALADMLERHPRAGVAGPRVRDERGAVERTVGRFPTLARERAHALFLDRLAGAEGRHAPFPARTAEVEWVSGCAWLLRADAARVVGPLDEGYFMYLEDVDYCRRLRAAGWSVLASPEIEVRHARGRGSSATGMLPADGGTALLRYFEKFHPEVPPAVVGEVLARGWRLRRLLHRALAGLGSRRSLLLATRYHAALGLLERSAGRGITGGPIDPASGVR
jgi:GT2 family glycosyltransferase